MKISKLAIKTRKEIVKLLTKRASEEFHIDQQTCKAMIDEIIQKALNENAPNN
jgi:hypothetical protein